MPSVFEPLTKHQIVLKDGITETWTGQAMEATVIYRCTWDERHDLMNELMGGYSNSATRFQDFVPPAQCPANTVLYCSGIESVRPVGVKHMPDPSMSKWSPYPYAEITAKFSAPDRDWESASKAGQISYANPILGCRQRIRASSQFLVMPSGKLKFVTSGTVVEESIGKPLPSSELTFTFSRLPFNPANTLMQYLGKVNWDNYLGHGRGQLLFDSMDVTEGVFSKGLACEVTLTILARDQSWNSFLNAKGEFEDVQYDASTATPKEKPFAYATFADLFTPTAYSVPTE